MNLAELFILAAGLSMDAFAVAVCMGLTMKKITAAKALAVGLYFGVFQAAMPLAGYAAAARFAGKIEAYSHWASFILLCFLGVKMIMGSFKKNNEEAPGSLGSLGSFGSLGSLSPAKMLPLAAATSVDAMAAGASFAFLQVNNIIAAVSLIGLTTLVLSAAGVKLGNMFGAKLKSKAEIAGGVILILIGFKILLERLGIIGF
jgi:putative Mn2+ efflux pump MntP